MKFLQGWSLKARVTVFTLAIFVISIWALTFYVSQMLRADMERELGEQQFSAVSVMAIGVNEDLADRFKGLENVAGRMNSTMLGNKVALQEFLDSQPVLQNMFSGGLVALDRDGTAIAEVPVSAGRIGINYADSDHVALTLKEGKSTIGRPTIGKKLHSPLFTIVTPIRDAQGKVIGALNGVLDLGKPNFLDKVTQSRYGETGGYLLIAPQYRLIVTATDKSRIMQPLPAPGANPQIDRYVQGAEGTAVYVNAVGVEILNSVKAIPVAGWYLAANLPTEEAFAPIREMQRRILIAAIIFTLLAGALTWWILMRELAPVLATIKTLATRSDTGQPLQPLPVAKHDEIGELISGFNVLLETLKQRESALKDSENRFRTMADGAPNPTMMHAEDGEVLMLNDAWTKISGYSLKDIPTTKSWAEKAYGVQPEAASEYIESMYSMQGLRQEGIHEVRTSLGEIRLWNFQSQSLPKLSDGRRVVLSLATDLTSEKDAEAALIAARKAADAANLAKSQFLANMSHELRTPLNGLLGHVQLLEMTNLDSKQHKYLSTAMQCGNNLLKLINDILDLSKIEAEAVALEQAEFNIRRCVNFLVLMQRSQIEKEDVALNLNIPEDIPDVLVGDELRLKQILLNLLSNAIKFTSKGSINVSLANRGHYENEVLIEFSVTDTGIGMSKTVADSVFKPFVQADSSTTRKFGGTGLGLTISRRLAELMGGSIAVESTEGIGSTFRVLLPFKIPGHVEQHSTPVVAAQALWTGPVMKVLLAEDNEYSQQFGVALMEKMGHQVNVVENGKEALAALERDPYDIVLMDIQMPVMDGSEALAALRIREQLTETHTPVIALTAYAVKGDEEKFHAAGFDGYVSKPLEVKKLVAEIKRVMGLN